jgi:hypothetical protein
MSTGTLLLILITLGMVFVFVVGWIVLDRWLRRRYPPRTVDPYTWTYRNFTLPNIPPYPTAIARPRGKNRPTRRRRRPQYFLGSPQSKGPVAQTPVRLPQNTQEWRRWLKSLVRPHDPSVGVSTRYLDHILFSLSEVRERCTVLSCDETTLRKFLRVSANYDRWSDSDPSLRAELKNVNDAVINWRGNFEHASLSSLERGLADGFRRITEILEPYVRTATDDGSDHRIPGQLRVYNFPPLPSRFDCLEVPPDWSADSPPDDYLDTQLRIALPHLNTDQIAHLATTIIEALALLELPDVGEPDPLVTALVAELHDRLGYTLAQAHSRAFIAHALRWHADDLIRHGYFESSGIEIGYQRAFEYAQKYLRHAADRIAPPFVPR